MALRKTLPKDFEALLEGGTLDELKSALEKCEPNARGGYGKQTALAFAKCPDELTRWLVARGADVNAEDTWGKTPLDHRITMRGNVAILLELGADVHHVSRSLGTALHVAADKKSTKDAITLLEHGAKVDAPNREGRTPLELALERCDNIGIPGMLQMAELLLERGASVRPSMKAAVTRIGETFEFQRAGFNPEHVDETSEALHGLYRLFDVAPVSQRRTRDGKATITVEAGTWQGRHEELWNLLVPPKGAAATVQGEVIRIAGRISHELLDNGGVNWDDDFRRMARDFLAHVRTGRALASSDIETLEEVIRAFPKDDDVSELARLGVEWVVRNPEPVALPAPSYRR